MPSLLVVAPYVPYDGVPHAGGSYLLHHLERCTAAGYRCTVLSLEAPGAARTPEWLDLRVATARPARGRAARLGDRVAHRTRGWAPLPQTLRGLAAAGVVHAARGADLVELHGPELAVVAPVLRRAGVTAPIAVLEHDVAREAAPRRAAAAGDRVDRLAQQLLAPLHRRNERVALSAADLVMVFKQADADLLARAGVTTPTLLLHPWLEPPVRQDRRRPSVALFTGALWRPENDAAARELVEQVWPLVRFRVPGAQLVVGGARPSPGLLACAQGAPGVEVTGELPDLAPLYEQAPVFVAPLRAGGGLKFKIPQAMAHGLAVVATPLAVEGVAELAPPGVLWGIADTAPDLANEVVRAFADPASATACGARAAAWARATWSFDAAEDRLLDVYRQLTVSRPGRSR